MGRHFNTVFYSSCFTVVYKRVGRSMNYDVDFSASLIKYLLNFLSYVQTQIIKVMFYTSSNINRMNVIIVIIYQTFFISMIKQ